MTDAEPTTVGRYRLIRKLARGGMAEVYLARSQGARGFEKTVAIKRILPHFAQDEQFVRMMVDEAKISVLLNHPNIAQIFEFGEENGEYFLVMEYVGGQSLSKLVKRMRKNNETMNLLEAVFVVMEMVEGLHAAHMQKTSTGEPARIIHRDVSPQNVLISWDGHVKVIDFGIARAKNRLERTEVGTIKGKLRYLAPEMIDPVRFSPRGDFDHRVDIFAAGIVLFELVSGRALFSGANELEVYDMITDADVPDLSADGRVPPDLQEILVRALAKEPANRFSSGEEMAHALRAFLYSRDPTFTPKRIGALMERYFNAERQALQQIELEDASGPKQAARELNLTRTGSIPMSVANNASTPQNPTTTDRKSSSSRSRKNRAVPPRIEGVEPGVRPDAETRVGLASEFSGTNSASHTQPVPSGHNSPSLGDFPGFDDENTRTRLPHSGVEIAEDGLTPATDTALLNQRNRAQEGSPSKRTRPIVWVLAGISGVAALLLIAIIVGIVIKSTGGGDSDAGVVAIKSDPTNPTNPQDPVNTNPAGSVPVLVDAEPSGALVELVGSGEAKRTVPAVYMATPGQSIEVRISAPHHETYRETITVPGTGDARIKAKLRALPVKIKVTTEPAGASITVDGQPYSRGITLPAGKQVTIRASKRGYVSAVKRVTLEAGKPLDLKLELKERGKTIVKPTGKGTLVVTTSPYWGRVTVDGRTLEDTTPVTVILKAGVHSVTVSHPPKGLVKKFKVNIKPGKKIRKTIKF